MPVLANFLIKGTQKNVYKHSGLKDTMLKNERKKTPIETIDFSATLIENILNKAIFIEY